MKTFLTLMYLMLGIFLLLQPASCEDRQEWQQPERVVADLGLSPGLEVADVGCGDGYFTFAIAEKVGARGTVYAADINADVLAAVKSRVDSEHWKNVQVVHSDPTDTKLKTNSLDMVFICDVIHEVDPRDRAGLMKDVVRSIKPGGFLNLIDYRKSKDVTFDPYERLVPKDDLIKLATDAGLTLDAEFHYLKYQVFLRFRK